ncbi:hypothetical protein ACVWZD_001337 [Streptomyces sp. TE3672]
MVVVHRSAAACAWSSETIRPWSRSAEPKRCPADGETCRSRATPLTIQRVDSRRLPAPFASHAPSVHCRPGDGRNRYGLPAEGWFANNVDRLPAAARPTELMNAGSAYRDRTVKLRKDAEAGDPHNLVHPGQGLPCRRTHLASAHEGQRSASCYRLAHSTTRPCTDALEPVPAARTPALGCVRISWGVLKSGVGRFGGVRVKALTWASGVFDTSHEGGACRKPVRKPCRGCRAR